MRTGLLSVSLALVSGLAAPAAPGAGADAPSAPLAPVLDADVLVPNGGVFRFFDFGGFRKENMPKLVRVFSESPYQEASPLRYDRLNWFEFERGPGEWRFDETVEPRLKRCLAERARLFLGVACNSGSMSVTQMHEGRALATPVYVFERCAAEGRPFRPCDQYGPSWVPDYDSPFLLERHRALLRAFAAWLEGTVAGTDVKRKDVVYGIEARYAGYWGEGAMRPEHYPKTDLLDAYAEAYVEAFPDTLVCMGGHETHHLPTRAAYEKNPADAAMRRAMTHVGKVFRLRNRRGPVGFFIDSWQSPNDQYDADSPRVLFGARGEVLSLADVFFGSVYRRRYVTGEFGYLTFLSDPRLAPYEKLPEQVAERGVSGLTLHNFTAKDRSSLVGVKRVRGAHYLPGGLPLSDETYARSRHAVAAVGYRLVLGSPKVERTAEGVRASFTLANVGVSRMFHDYNRIHLMAYGADGRLVEDRPLAFRLGSLGPAARPLAWDESAGARFAETFPANVAEVRVRIPDEKGVERPLCLSNRGRDGDGAYSLGRVREKVLFDTDIGGDPDDALALAYLLREPRCDLLGVTTVAGRPELAARIASALCRSLGRPDVPVRAGCSLPILRGRDLAGGRDAARRAREAAWERELARWPHEAVANDRSAVAFLRRTIRANPGEVTLCATGPLSNVAALFAVDPEIPSLLKRLVVMGGDFRPGTGEWNAAGDVFATAAVLEGGYRKPPKELLLVGADATSAFSLPPDEGRAFLAQAPCLAFVRGHCAEQWFARPIDLFFHDPAAAVAIFRPDVLATARSAVRVDVADGAKTARAAPGGDATWTWATATAVDFGRLRSALLAALRP